jgi:class 3 adenylate cyclase/tetratricopeptide (TPR) repeat protein
MRKTVTIVFADVTDSTALGERLDPEPLRRVMGRYFDAMATVIERHGGIVEKFIGDAVMAVFGVPRLHEDDALRAVRAADDMGRALDALNADLESDHGLGLAARIGVNTGEVVAGDPAEGQRLVTGDAVNVAARLEQAAGPGEVLLGGATYLLLRDAVEVEPVDLPDLKGKAERVDAFRLVRVLEDVPGHARHLDSEMVGRRRELEMLERALDRAVTERTSHLFTLLGPAGVGKSRLVQEFVTNLVTNADVLRGRCLSYGEGITYFPLIEIVQAAAGVERGDDLTAARGKLARLADGIEDRDRVVALVAGLLAWDEPVAAEDAQWGVRKMFEHLARDRPVVIVFDDIHWAEPALLDLIEHVADRARDAPLLIVCVARPELLELRPGWAGGKLNATSILLEPLAGDEVARLVDNLLGRAAIPDDTLARIMDAADGNPLFVEEMLGMLIDDGILRLDEGVWRAEDLAQITVPPTIQLLLAARLDRLDAEERAVIERGAVEGKVFHSGAVTTLAPESLRAKIPSCLLALARKELIRPDRAEFAGEDAFRFRHLLIRDAAYQAMPKEKRADLHERLAAWLERVAGDRVSEYEEILGYHLEQAYRFRVELGMSNGHTADLGRSAASRLIASAERARERSDVAVAGALLKSAEEMSDGVLRARAAFELAVTLIEAFDFQACAEAAERAIDVARASGDRVHEVRSRLILAEARAQLDPTYTLAGTETVAEEALTELKELGDQDGIAHATLTLARQAFFQGRSARCIDIAERLLDRAATMRFSVRQDIALNLGSASYFGPLSVADAIRMHEFALALVEHTVITRAGLLNARAALWAMQGREDEWQAENERVDRMVAETTIGNLFQSRGEAARVLGRLEEAEAIFRRAVEFWDARGETAFNSTITGLLALVLCDLERFDEAEDQAARGRDLAAQDDFASHAVWHMARARVRSHQGDHDGALIDAREAVSILDATDYLAWQAEGDEVHGTVLAAAGRTGKARAALVRSIERFERKGVVPAVARVRERLASLLGRSRSR